MTPQNLVLLQGGAAGPEHAPVGEAGSRRDPARDASTHTLRLLGELSHRSASLLEAEIEYLCKTGIEALTLDLSRLESIDWAGVRVIAFRSGWCERCGCQLTIVPGSAQVQQVFELHGRDTTLLFREGTPTLADVASEEQLGARGAGQCPAQGGVRERRERHWKRTRMLG